MVSDVDGDGELDQMDITGSEGTTFGRMTYRVRIIKMNLFDVIKTLGRYCYRLDLGKVLL